MIVFDDSAASHRIAAVLGIPFNREADHSIAVVDPALPVYDAGYFKCGALFTNYTTTAIWAHLVVSAPKSVTRDFIIVGFHYAFVQLGCKRVYGFVESTNAKALALYKKHGFEHVCCLPDLFATGPGVVVSITADRCAWLRHGLRTLKEGGSHGERRFGSRP